MVISQAESFRLAASRYLDVGYTDLSVGHRIRKVNEMVFVDIYLYDNLSSGAGYAFRLADILEEFLKEAKLVLEHCPSMCKTACHDCLKNYWNQKKHRLLNCSEALELFKWIRKEKLPNSYKEETQKIILETLLSILKEADINAEIKIYTDSLSIYYNKNEMKIKVVQAIYSDCYFNNYKGLIISDKIIEFALALAYEKFIKFN